VAESLINYPDEGLVKYPLEIHLTIIKTVITSATSEHMHPSRKRTVGAKRSPGLVVVCPLSTLRNSTFEAEKQ